MEIVPAGPCHDLFETFPLIAVRTLRPACSSRERIPRALRCSPRRRSGRAHAPHARPPPRPPPDRRHRAGERARRRQRARRRGARPRGRPGREQSTQSARRVRRTRARWRARLPRMRRSPRPRAGLERPSSRPPQSAESCASLATVSRPPQQVERRGSLGGDVDSVTLLLQACRTTFATFRSSSTTRILMLAAYPLARYWASLHIHGPIRCRPSRPWCLNFQTLGGSSGSARRLRWRRAPPWINLRAATSLRRSSVGLSV